VSGIAYSFGRRWSYRVVGVSRFGIKNHPPSAHFETARALNIKPVRWQALCHRSASAGILSGDPPRSKHSYFAAQR
jgi:hypothetical protein